MLELFLDHATVNLKNVKEIETNKRKILSILKVHSRFFEKESEGAHFVTESEILVLKSHHFVFLWPKYFVSSLRSANPVLIRFLDFEILKLYNYGNLEF